MNLDQLPIGTTAVIESINHPLFSTKLAELGIFKGTQISVVMKAPFSGPLAIQFGQTLLSIRHFEAKYLTLNLSK